MAMFPDDATNSQYFASEQRPYNMFCAGVLVCEAASCTQAVLTASRALLVSSGILHANVVPSKAYRY